ncbi:hypothetical protein GEMRC1_003340 [Eukaryota sp. GEM-RC1]
MSIIQSLNQLFPDLPSLSKLSSSIHNQEVSIAQSEQKLRQQVRDDLSDFDTNLEHISIAKRSFTSLQTHLSSLQGRLSSEELTNNSVFTNVATLDLAKKNLSSTIVLIRRISLLLRSLEYLDSRDQDCSLADVKGHISSAIELSKCLKPYSSLKIPVHSTLHTVLERVSTHTEQILARCFSSIESLPIKNPPQEDLDSFSNAIDCVEDLGSKSVKSSFISLFLKKLLLEEAPINSSFTNSLLSGSLDQRSTQLFSLFSLYYSFFHHCFPPCWNVPLLLGNQFAGETRTALFRALDTLIDGNNDPSSSKITSLSRDFDGSVLLALFRRTKKLENDTFKCVKKELSLDLDGDDEDENDIEGILHKVTVKSNMSVKDSSEINNIKKKYKQLLKNRNHDPNEIPKEINPFVTSMTSAFDVHMNVYVSDEQTKLRSVIFTIFDSLDENDQPSMKDNEFIFNSAFVLFKQIKAIIHRTTKLSEGQLLFNVYLMLKKELITYSEALRNCLTSGEKIKKDSLEELNIIKVISTSNFCIVTIMSLCESIKDIILPAFSTEVHFDDVASSFNQTINQAGVCFSSSVMAYLNSSILLFSRQNWGNWSQVGDASSWIKSVEETLFDRILILQKISECPDVIIEILENIVVRLAEQISNCIFKKIGHFSNFGAQQMLVDLVCLKSILGDLPSQFSIVTFVGYSRSLRNNLERLEMFIKVLLSPPKMLVRNYISLIGISSSNEFCKFLELKGIKGIQSQPLMQEYLEAISKT